MTTEFHLTADEAIVLAHLRSSRHNSTECRMCQLYSFGVQYGHDAAIKEIASGS